MLLVWNELGRLDDGRPEHRDPTDPAVSGVLDRTLVFAKSGTTGLFPCLSGT